MYIKFISSEEERFKTKFIFLEDLMHLVHFITELQQFKIYITLKALQEIAERKRLSLSGY